MIIRSLQLLAVLGVAVTACDDPGSQFDNHDAAVEAAPAVGTPCSSITDCAPGQTCEFQIGDCAPNAQATCQNDPENACFSEVAFCACDGGAPVTVQCPSMGFSSVQVTNDLCSGVDAGADAGPDAAADAGSDATTDADGD